MMTLIEQRLRDYQVDSKPLFTKVGNAIDPEQVISDGIIQRDAAFVVPVSENAVSGPRTTVRYSQEIAVNFGVLIAVRNINDRLGSDINTRLTGFIKETRNALLGWEITPTSGSVEFIQGELASFARAGVFWMETYSTSYLFTQE